MVIYVLKTNIFDPNSASYSFLEKRSLTITFYFRQKRSSRPEVFCKKGVLGNFAKFTRKHL